MGVKPWVDTWPDVPIGCCNIKIVSPSSSRWCLAPRCKMKNDGEILTFSWKVWCQKEREVHSYFFLIKPTLCRWWKGWILEPIKNPLGKSSSLFYSPISHLNSCCFNWPKTKNNCLWATAPLWSISCVSESNVHVSNLPNHVVTY
jgi:hypothetical protein